MGADVFSREQDATGDVGRIAKIGKKQETLRIRSVALWVGAHWVGEPGLCAGSLCPLCEAGVPKRPKAWFAVDRANGSMAIFEVTAGDIGKFTAACTANGFEFGCGVALLLMRTGDRQPLSCLNARLFPKLGEVAQDVVMSDVLRVHGIAATVEQIRTGEYRSLVVNRARELARKSRVPA